MNAAPTFLGLVKSVRGSTVSIRQSESVASGLVIIGGTTYRIGQVGSFVRIPQGYQDLYGVVAEVGVAPIPDTAIEAGQTGERWMTVQLVGEGIGTSFERGLSQYPNVNDEAHLVTEADLARIYGEGGKGQIPIGRLSSAESMLAQLDIDKLVTRHCAIVGSTGAGKSTTIASLLRSITKGADGDADSYPSARLVLLDIHGEYSRALGDISTVFRVGGQGEFAPLYVPFWALDPLDMQGFLFGQLDDKQSTYIYDKITNLKTASLDVNEIEDVEPSSITSATPLPYSLMQLWFDLIHPEIQTLEGDNRDQPAILEEGDAEKLTPNKYKPHAMGGAGPFLSTTSMGIQRQLGQLRFRLLDKQYDFLLHPGPWEPNLAGKVASDLDELIESWLGHDKAITILDLSGVPSLVLDRLIGNILKIIYEAMFWSRVLPAGARQRPLLFVMEEAHRYLSNESSGTAREMVQRIVKEGRKYGIGATLISQRPSEIDETVLSQCGTFVALRLSNPSDRSRVQASLPDSLSGLMDMLPVLRTGEAVISGEAAKLPVRCRVFLPEESKRPDSGDPDVSDRWSQGRGEEDYSVVVSAWRSQDPYSKKNAEE